MPNIERIEAVLTNGPPPADRPLRRVVTINNPQGLHIRPAAAFAEMAARFESRVTVSREGQSADGKFWPDLILLAAEQGTNVVLEVDGRDADSALEKLAAALAAVFEDESAGDLQG